MGAVRWSIAVSEDTDRSLRTLLASQGLGKKGNISKFVEEAVQRQVFEQTVSKIKKENAHFSETEIQQTVDDAIQWARSNR